MRADITSWWWGCITCATRNVGEATHTPFWENQLSTIAYGRDTKLPTEAVLCPPPSFALQIKKLEMPLGKPRCSRNISIVIVPVQLHPWKASVCLSSMTYKLARPYHGPYSVVRVVENGVEVRPVDKPYSATTLVALNQVYRCPEEMPNVFWPQKDVFASSLDPTIACLCPNV